MNDAAQAMLSLLARGLSTFTRPETALGWITVGVMLAVAWFFWTPLRRRLRWLVFRVGSHLLVVVCLYLVHELLQSRNVQLRLGQLVGPAPRVVYANSEADDE